VAGFSTRGAEQLADLGRALKHESKVIRKEALAGIRNEGKPAIAAARVSALATLPSSGTLAARVAKSPIGVRTRLSGASVGVRIVATGKKGAQALEEIDGGTVRHPVFGNRNIWRSQSVTPGWFTRPLESHAPRFRGALSAVMDDIAKKIERSV
jgi:hypothetical protein